MIRHLLIAIFLLLQVFAVAQKTMKAPISIIKSNSFSDSLIINRQVKSVYFNFLGDVSFISLNYEQLKFIKPYLFISGKIGLGYNEPLQICFSGDCTFPEPPGFITVPHHLTINIGKKKHFFEAGIGGTYVHGEEVKKYFVYPVIGYRVQPLKKKKVMFRLFFNIQAFNSLEDYPFLNIPVGYSIGICF
ncbi:MAG: hypothetical protein GXC73_14435 [Chitinophagaceae bacterium]|nr:hypothetical protein [Chitinophagaceae bacterium]